MCAERVAPVRVGDAPQLVDGRLRHAKVAGRDGDLDLRRQEPRACKAIPRLVLDRAVDRRQRTGSVPLGELEERAARLRVEPELGGLAERLGGARVVADAEPDLADLVEGARRDGEPEVLQLLGRRARGLLCLRPRATELHHLGLVDAALTGEARDRLSLAPALRGLGPLAGAAVVGEVAARLDHVAVDDRGRVRADLAVHRRERGLVELTQAVVDVALGDVEAPEVVERQRHHVLVAVARSEVERVLREVHRLVELTVRRGVRRAAPRDVRVLDALRLAVEEALSALEPR